MGPCPGAPSPPSLSEQWPPRSRALGKRKKKNERETERSRGEVSAMRARGKGDDRNERHWCTWEDWVVMKWQSDHDEMKKEKKNRGRRR